MSNHEKIQIYLELEKLYLRRAKEAREEIKNLSIMENSYCPECGSRVYVDEDDEWKCMKEKGECSVLSLYKVNNKEESNNASN